MKLWTVYLNRAQFSVGLVGVAWRGEARRVHLPGSYQPAGRCVNLCDWIVPALIGAQVRPLPFSATPPPRSVQLCRLSMTLVLIRHPCKLAESWAALTNYLLCNCELSTFPSPAARWLPTDKLLEMQKFHRRKVMNQFFVGTKLTFSST